MAPEDMDEIIGDMRVIVKEKGLMESREVMLKLFVQLVREFDDRGRVFHAAVDVAIEGDQPVPEPRGTSCGRPSSPMRWWTKPEAGST